MTRLGLRSGAFDGVVAFYSLIHVPRDEQQAVLRSVADWLRPGGVLVATMAARDLPGGTDDDWRGVEMYWSGYDTATNLALVRDAGLKVLQHEEVAQHEDGKTFTFLWIVARRDV